MQKQSSNNSNLRNNFTVGASSNGLTAAIAHKIILEYDDVLNLKQQFSDVLNCDDKLNNNQEESGNFDKFFTEELNTQKRNGSFSNKNDDEVFESKNDCSMISNRSLSQEYNSCIEHNSEVSNKEKNFCY